MAVELIGGALFSSLFQVAFQRLASPDILDYFRGRKLLKRLEVTLLAINVVIDDAENKQIKDLNIKRWVDEVKDAAYEAEDLLDEIDTEVSKRKQLEAEGQASKTSKVWKSLRVSVSSFDKKIKSRMKKVLGNLEILESKKDMLGLTKGGGIGVGSGRMPDRSTTSLVDKSEICGRNDEKEKIIECLLSDNVRGNRPYSVISVVAMGGMGKTTLAQLVYNDERVESEFHVKAWVYVSEEFDVIRVTRTILEAITRSTDDTKDKNMLQHKLKEQLAGRKFLLILDDVWNDQYLNWEDLEKPFLDGVQGSKILVTSRSDKVADAMRSIERIHLEELKEEDSWLLFSKHAFYGKNPDSYPSLEEIGRKIMKKCGGLPLALKTIGSLLYSKEAKEEWNSILTSEIWEMSDDGGDILPALRLSYYYLPSNLKRCFAYCSLFPKGYRFDEEYLIWLWKGENLLHCSQNNKRVKEVGHHCFNELLTRSFFQYSKIHNYFIMHDLLCDLAKYVSGEFCFRLEEEEVRRQTISKKSRHFSFVSTKSSTVSNKHFEATYKADKMRTFLHVDMNRYQYTSPLVELVDNVLSKFQCLRVLSFCRFDVTELPDSIGQLKHLRYLNLSSTKIVKLPGSICLLCNLQVLMLRSCIYLVELPSDFHKLVNLLYLNIEHTKVRKMPLHIGKLKKLQILTSFFVGKSSESNILQLAELDLGEELSISGLQSVVNPMDALAVNLKNKIHLDKLMLEWETDDNESERTRSVLEKLQPHQNLKELSIRGYGGKMFPNWFGDYSLHLVVLRLNCNCLLLPPFGLLPSLKELYFRGCHSLVKICHEFYGDSSSSNPFRSLEMLSFDDMKGWEDWECKDIPNAFPVLQYLKINDCPKLKELFFWKSCNFEMISVPEGDDPYVTSLEISQCPNLEKLYIHNCPSIEERLTMEHLICNLSSLKRFCFGNCQRLKCLSKECLCHLSSLEVLCFYSCPILECLPKEYLYHLSSLKSLILYDCPELELFPEGDLPPNLKNLTIHNCSKLVASRMSWGLHIHNSLETLEIEDYYLESFPDEGLLPRSLKHLSLSRCHNLRTLDFKGLCHLSSLTSLRFYDCPKLECLPNEGLPSSLSSLVISSCYSLEKRCQKEKGEDWGKIAHISKINIRFPT